MLRPDFAVRRTGERYDRADVDAFVNRVLAVIERGTPSLRPELTRADVRNATFGRPIFGAGYAADQVDDFMTQALNWLPADEPPHRAAHQASRTPQPSRQFDPPEFSPVRLRAAYDMDEVDEFVDRVMATVNRRPVDRPVTERDIREVAFSVVRLREGYEIEQVDLFLDRAEEWLRHL